MQTRRVAGKVKTEHIASLGSVDADVSVRDRIDFWSKIPERLARLANRVGPEEQGAIYAALHARIPMVTPDDQRVVQEENAEADERFWSSMHGLNAASAEEHKALIASAESKLREHESAAADAAEEAQAANRELRRIIMARG
jgi:hypothetical protein